MASAVTVRLGDRSYLIHCERGLIFSFAGVLADLALGHKCAVITDDQVRPLYADTVLQSLVEAGYSPLLLTVSAGEKSKSLIVVESLLEKMTLAGLDRSSFVVALGGGVIGDLAGFVASIYFRGIPYLQIPTTILAQVDSSVGGKTGVNLSTGKNLVGSFHQPRAVFADPDTLDTLPERAFNEGFAEIIKHAIIRDAALFQTLTTFQRSDRDTLADIIRTNIAIKADIVSQDEHETLGLRALLNFGHTIGHGIENAAGYGNLLHGEAISLGILAATRLSVKKAGLSDSACASIHDLLVRFRLPTQLPASITTDSVLQALARDKKFTQGQIRFVLITSIGEAFLSSDVTLDEIQHEIDALR